MINMMDTRYKITAESLTEALKKLPMKCNNNYVAIDTTDEVLRGLFGGGFGIAAGYILEERGIDPKCGDDVRREMIQEVVRRWNSCME